MVSDSIGTIGAADSLYTLEKDKEFFHKGSTRYRCGFAFFSVAGNHWCDLAHRFLGRAYQTHTNTQLRMLPVARKTF